HELVHEPDVLAEGLRNAARPLERRQAGRLAGRLGGLDAPLDLAQGVEVVADLAAVGRAERAREAREIRRHGIENAAVLSRAREALLVRAAVAEQALEDEPRVVLGRQRARRRTPRQRVQVNAAIAVLAHAREEAQIDRQLE